MNSYRKKENTVCIYSENNNIVFNKMIELFKKRNFEIARSDNSAVLTKDGLEAKARSYCNSVEIEFKKGTSLKIRNELNHIIKALGKKYRNRKHELAVDVIKNSYIEDEYMKEIKNMDFDLDKVKVPEINENSNKDRDKKEIKNGDIKFCRDNSGRLRKGKVYYRHNYMWWIVYSKTEYNIKSSCDLFDATEEDIELRKEVNKLKTERLNPKSYRYDNQEYRIGDNLFIINERTGLFKANTDFGNYKYYWSDNDLKGLLIRVDRYYVLGKLAKMDTLNFKESIEKAKEDIKYYEDEGMLEESDYEKAIEAIEGIDDYDIDSISLMERELYDIYNENNICTEDFTVVKEYSKDTESFYELFLKFQEILKQETREA